MNAQNKKEAERLIIAGHSARDIALVLGVRKGAIRWIRHLLNKQGVRLICPCGKHSSHRGWCCFREKNNSGIMAYRAMRRSDFVTRNLETQIDGYRICTCCKKKKSTSHFYIRRRIGAIMKWREQCKKCLNEKAAMRWREDKEFREGALLRNKKWQQNHRKESARYTAAWKERNPGSALRGIKHGRMFADNAAAFMPLPKAERFLVAPILDPLDALIEKEESASRENRVIEAGIFNRFCEGRQPLCNLAELLEKNGL